MVTVHTTTLPGIFGPPAAGPSGREALLAHNVEQPELEWRDPVRAFPTEQGTVHPIALTEAINHMELQAIVVM